MQLCRAPDLSAAFQRVHGITIPKEVVTAITKKPAKADSSALSKHPDWEYDPVNFRVFCESKEHMNMLPKDWKYETVDQYGDGALSKKQYADCIAILGDDPMSMFDPAVRKYVFGGLLWSKGCCLGSTVLYDEVSKKNYTFKEVVDNNLVIHVKVYNEKTKKIMIKQVARIFSKGIAKLLKFKMKSGREIIVSPDHRFYDGKAWVRAGDLYDTKKIAVLQKF